MALVSSTVIVAPAVQALPPGFTVMVRLSREMV